MTGHDRLFKELLCAFFLEFLELFLPHVRAFVKAGSLVFLDKEIFVDVTAGERLEPDIVAKVQLKDSPAFFIIHVENQSQAQKTFPRRLFRYFSRLHDKYGLPVYPVAVLSFKTPRKQQPRLYQVRFPNRVVLTFRYDVVQLNRLNWRKFIKKPNPIAAALMAKMNIAPEDRPRVKWECLRLLATLKLDSAKSKLISGFIDTYLPLNAQEQAQLHATMEARADEETEKVMEIVTSWMKDGIKQGRREGLQKGLRKGRQEGLQEGHEQGFQEGQLKASQEAVLEVLETRFTRLPVSLRKALAGIEDPERLKLLLREAATVTNLKEFKQSLEDLE